MSVKRTKQEAVFRLEIDREYLYGTKDEKKNAWPYDMVIEMLKDPDYVKVVRCKDCDRAFHDTLVVNGTVTEETWICKNTKAKVNPQGFCNNGGKR